MTDGEISRKSCARMLCAAALILLSAAGSRVRAEPARYEIDPEHLSIGFLVDHIGYAKVLGMFRKARGSFSFDEDSKQMSDLQVTIESDSVFTNHRKRDEHLRSAEFLNSGEFPTLVFRAERIEPVDERRFRIPGQLQLLGTSSPVTLEATWNKSAEYPFGGGVFGSKPYVLGVSARGSFKRSAHGMNYSLDNGWVGDEIQLIIEFEARRQ